MAVIGGIIIWSGAIVDIPMNWQLCDGTNGTPNLRDRFIQGAGGALAVDATGGFPVHAHTFNSDFHSHEPQSTAGGPGGGAEEMWDAESPSSDERVEGTTDGGSSIPPFYALAYIQRMA